MPSAHRSRHRSWRQASILIVDDAPASLRRLAGHLAEMGYELRFTSGGEVALKLVQTKLPALILLAVNLPDGSGYQVCQALKADARTRPIPVVFLSTSTASQARLDAFRAGGIDFIVKPIDQPVELAEVLARLEAHLNMQGSQQQVEQRLQNMRLLQQVTEALRSEPDSQRAFELAVAQIGPLFQVSRAAIHIYVPPPIPEIPLVAEYVEAGHASLRQIDFTLADSLFLPELLAYDQALAATDVYSDARLQPIYDLCRTANIHALLAVRTSYRHQPNGVLILQQCQPRLWTDEEKTLLEAIAAPVGMALAQAKLLEQEQKQSEALGYQNLILRQEICERRQVETALQESEAELRALFAAMVDVILVLDRQGRYLRIAPTSPHNLYRPADELLGKTVRQVFAPDQAELFLGHIQASLGHRQPVDFEYSLVIGNRTVWFTAKISPIGKDTVICVARDITARKQTEAELLHKTVALSSFSSNLKHLHRLSLTDFETIADLCADYLKTGCEILGFTTGIVGQVQGESCQLLAVHSDPPLLIAGFDLNQDSYCQEVLQRRQTVCSTDGRGDRNPALEQETGKAGRDRDFGWQRQSTSASQTSASQTSAYIGTPVWVEGELFGSLCFFSAQPRPQGYQNHESEIIELMAQSIGKFISGHRIRAKRQQAEEAVQLLLNITQAMTAAPDFDQALYAALSALCQATGWIYGEVWLPAADHSVLESSPVWYCNPEGQPASAIAAVKRLRQSLEAVTFQPNEGIAGRVWSRQQPEWTLAHEDTASEAAIDSIGFVGNSSDWSEAHWFATEHGQYRFQLVNHYGIKARLGVPITVTADCRPTSGSTSGPASPGRSIVLAVLVFFTVEARQQDERLIQLVSAVATQLGTVLAQKQAEAELQALFTAMNDSVLVRDATGRCLKVASLNPSLDQPAVLLGKTLQDSLPLPQADRLLHGIQTSLANRSTVTLEYSLPLADRQIWLLASISPLSADTVLIVERDISDRKQVEEALARRERYLAALVEVQRALLAFRTPSNQIQDSQYQEILGILGRIAAASHVYIYANQRQAGGKLRLSPWASWSAADLPLTKLPDDLYSRHPRWEKLLGQGETISGSRTSFPAAEQTLLADQDILAILLLPLVVNGQFWGFIGFDECTATKTWDELEINLLRTAASAIALHHERSLVEDALRQGARREQATLRLIERMRQTLEIEQIFRTTVEELQALLQCDRVLIYRFNPDWSGEFVAEAIAPGWISVMPAAAGQGLDFTTVDSAANPDGRACVLKSWTGSTRAAQPSERPSEQILFRDTYLQDTQGGAYSQGAKYLCVRDVQQAGLTDCYLNLLHQLQARAYLTVPIFQGQRLWGLLAAYQNGAPRDWQPSEIHLVTHISTQFGVALQQADLLAQTQRQSAALEKARDAAEAANRAKTQFLAHMSHEFRTPLNSILGFTQLMTQDGMLQPEHREYLAIVNRSGQHLLELINQVLEVARLEANRASLQPSRFHLPDLLESITEMLRLSAAEKQLQLSLEVAPDVPYWIVTDKGKLRQVLLNLLDNAIKFTQVGRVSLRVTWETDGSLSLHQSGRLWFQVQDTGHGIAPEEMDSLFEAFVQTESGRQSNQGTGLGLVISHRFVQLMGGQLRVRSKIGEGSVFKFDLPCNSPAADRVPFGPPPTLDSTPGLLNEIRTGQLSPGICAPSDSPPQLPITADLSRMPLEWVHSLQQAARGCSDRQVLHLIQQIPADQAWLAEQLKDLVYHFRFEEIVELTQQPS